VELSVVQHESLDDALLVGEWRALSERAPRATVFNTVEWCRCWHTSVGGQVRPNVLRFVRDGVTVGIAQTCIEETRVARWLQGIISM
jgi:hypothetical protein